MAAKLYEQSAAQGNSNAMNDLGFCYRYGYGVNKNLERAIEWFQKAADAGNNWGVYNIGCVYAYDHGDNDSLNTAINYFKKVLNLGITDALNDLGCCYEMLRELETAFDYFMQSAKRGNVKAEEWIAEAYNSFIWYGVERDKYKAEEWYRRAAKHGSKKAQKYLTELEEQRTSEARRNLEETKAILRENDRMIDDLGKSPWDRFWSRF